MMVVGDNAEGGFEMQTCIVKHVNIIYGCLSRVGCYGIILYQNAL